MNCRNISFQLDDFRIQATSIGADETYFLFKELKFSFDVGKCPRPVIMCDNILLTHLHMDHCAGIPYYISTRGLYNLKPGRIFVNGQESAKIEKLMRVWQEMEYCRYQFELVPVEPFKPYFISKDLFFKPFPAHHRVPCLGYTVFKQVRKLKREFLTLTGPQIVELKKNNVEIVDIHHVPLVSFLGDTNIRVFQDEAALELFRDSKLLILEATFVAGEDEGLALGRGHMHLTEIKKILPLLNNPRILLTHFSQRYPEHFITKSIKSLFSKEQRDRLVPLCPGSLQLLEEEVEKSLPDPRAE